jgi:cytochrome c
MKLPILCLARGTLRSRAVILVGMAVALSTPALAAEGDVEAGKTVFKKCALCHTTEAGKNKIGPSLFGIVGRHSATVPNFSYSQAMKDLNQNWDDKTLDTYLKDPKATVTGTKMIFPGLKDQKERDDVITYLGTLK